MQWYYGDIWTTNLNIDKENAIFQYKYIIVGGTLTKWETGYNRIADLKIL